MPEVMVTKVPDKKEDGEQPQKMTMARLMNLMPVICSNFSKVQIFPLSYLAFFRHLLQLDSLEECMPLYLKRTNVVNP